MRVGDQMVTEQIRNEEVPMPRMVYLNYCLPSAYSLRGVYERVCQTILRSDSRIARLVTSRSDRGAYDHMETLYQGEPSKEGIFGGKLDETFMLSRGGKSIKTRTNRAEELNYKYAKGIATRNDGEVNILSLGCGSAREIIFPLKKLKDDGIVKVHATCVDINPEAIKFSSKLAEEAGVLSNITYRKNDILDVRCFPDEPNTPEKFDLISIIGMCEYFKPEDNKIWLTHHVNERLKPRGYLIATNMKKHDRLITWAMNVSGWRLVYKEPDDFSRIVRESGLDIVEELYEPDTELHRFVVGQKPN